MTGTASAACWAKVGIVAVPKVVSWTELNQAIHGHTAPRSDHLDRDLPDPDIVLFTLLDSEGTYMEFPNAAVDSVISRGRSERSMEIAWVTTAT
jgi:ABC-type transport system substrate-binding protein